MLKPPVVYPMIFVIETRTEGDDRWKTFTKLFGSLLVFVYHCFDRIIISFCLRRAAWRKARLSASIHLQEHGTGPDVSDQRAEVSYPDPNHRILAHQTSRFTGPIILRVASLFRCTPPTGSMATKT
jgi:hypothetical protein